MGIRAKPSFALKDQLFNAEGIAVLSERLFAADAGFQKKQFTRSVLERFPQLELKQRIDWIVSTLEQHLPGDFNLALDILHATLPPPLDPTKCDDDFGKFLWVVPGEYVAKHGCTDKHLQSSLAFLRESTKRASAESAIRPFLNNYPAETMEFVRTCTSDKNYHVRRLASEGTRPFLPWAQRVDLPLDALIDILDRLHADDTRYVTRSVANALNDISKIDADRVLQTLKRWQGKYQQDAAELEWMGRHALRTLLKKNHEGALQYLGYTTQPKFSVANIDSSTQVKLGESFTWRSTLTSLAEQKLKITLHIHFLKAGGTHSRRVFAVKSGNFGNGDVIEIVKRQAFKPITTRALYPGTHYAELVVNGKACERRAFELLV